MGLQAEQLEARDDPAVFAGDATGAVHRLDADTGAETGVVRPDPAYMGRWLVAAGGDELFTAADAPGGPRVDAYDAVTLALKWSVFVGDPAGRGGASVAWRAEPAPVRSVLRAEPYPGRPGDVAAVQARLDTIPLPVQRRLVTAGDRVLVYAGAAITELPEFAALRGQPTATPGDGDRTYDQVPNAGLGPPGSTAYLSDPATAVHEAMHGAFWLLGGGEQRRWRELHPRVAWGTAYEAADPLEAWAETGRRWVQGLDQPSPAVAAFVADTLALWS